MVVKVGESRWPPGQSIFCKQEPRIAAGFLFAKRAAKLVFLIHYCSMKTVVITGVSRGIGRAIAERFLENGDFVIGTSTSGESSIEHKNLTVL